MTKKLLLLFQWQKMLSNVSITKNCHQSVQSSQSPSPIKVKKNYKGWTKNLVKFYSPNDPTLIWNLFEVVVLIPSTSVKCVVAFSAWWFYYANLKCHGLCTGWLTNMYQNYLIFTRWTRFIDFLRKKLDDKISS